MFSNGKLQLFYLALFCAIIFSLVGCRTPYQSYGFTGGYTDQKICNDKFLISVIGNGYTSLGEVESHFFRRAEEIAKENGCTSYKVLKHKTSMEPWATFVMPNSRGTIQCLKGSSPSPVPSPQPVVRQPSVKQQVVAGGTGFLFGSKDYVITNYHVVKGADSILAKFTNGETVEAKVVAKDVRSDIAILKLEQSPPLSATQIKLGDSSQARMGEKIFTIGYPASKIMGEKPKYSEGVINAMTGLKDDPAFFQISVPVQPGNSGGPLFNERGEVIGITTASLSSLAMDAMGAIAQNVNYAIKSSFVKNLLSTIPELMLSNTGIVVVPNEPEKSLPNFIEQVSKNIVLIEAKE